jgi:urease accessory protein
VCAVAGPRGTVLDELRGEAPIGLFPGPCATPGWAQVWLVGSAGGPLGGDDVELQIDVGAGASLAIGSVAASLVLAGAAPSTTRVRVVVRPGGRLAWTPEPLIVTGRADHRVDVHVDAAADARVWWRDELVLGRAGEQPGRCTVVHAAELGGVPWLRHEFGVGAPGWNGAAVVGEFRFVGSLLTTEDTAGVDPLALDAKGHAAELQLEAGGSITVALASDRMTLDRLLPARPGLPRFAANAPAPRHTPRRAHATSAPR